MKSLLYRVKRLVSPPSATAWASHSKLASLASTQLNELIPVNAGRQARGQAGRLTLFTCVVSACVYPVESAM